MTVNRALEYRCEKLGLKLEIGKNYYRIFFPNNAFQTFNNYSKCSHFVSGYHAAKVESWEIGFKGDQVKELDRN